MSKETRVTHDDDCPRRYNSEPPGRHGACTCDVDPRWRVHCLLTEHDGTMSITVRSASSNDAGGCNNCDRYVTPEGGAEHRVWVIEISHIEIRLCNDCLSELSSVLPHREINGRLWGKGDLVHSHPCTVKLTEDAIPGRSVQGWCSYCESIHHVDTKQLGRRWMHLLDREASDG